jgi:hypothetical protein
MLALAGHLDADFRRDFTKRPIGTAGRLQDSTADIVPRQTN